jgi:putative tryptophan/tyrosine transport system substrate-binding protein
MKRREFITLLGGAAAWPLAARAQQGGKVHRVGLIATMSPVSELAGPEPVNPAVRAFVQGLRVLGYVEGRNLILERRSAEGAARAIPHHRRRTASPQSGRDRDCRRSDG